MHRAAHSSSQVLGGERYRLITPQCETLWCSLCGRSAGRSDSCALREPPSLAWLDNWQLRGIPCGPTSSRVCEPHLMTLLVLRGFGCWGLMRGVWHHQDRRRRGPRELTGIVDLTRGEDHPTARLSGPGPRKVWHRLQELAGRARRRLSLRYPSLRYPDRGAGPLPGTERTPSTINSKTLPASSMPFTSSSSLATLQVRCVARIQQDTTGHRARTGDPLYPGPQSFARLAPQAHSTSKGTPPWGLRGR